MLSRSSFEAELIAFRDSRKRPRFNEKGKLVEPGNRSTADLQVIERWINHPNREAIWKTIRRAAPDLQATGFIKEVLRARRTAVGTVNHSAKLQEEWAILKKHLSDNLSEPNIEILFKAYNLHMLWQDTVGEFKLSRQDIRGSRKLLLFSRIIGDYLQAKCGGWLDVQIAQLAEIALDLDPGSVSPKTIKDARRQRPKKAH
jgi:hypothetical protein